ncbi:HET-domain-containing protein [Xylaria sp. CBS 124048]|nr:HET-domain-containing protein [Xylaria sp. CBS 124048]
MSLLFFSTMNILTLDGANLLGQRVGALFNGALTATTTLFFDWILPAWCKRAYLVFDHVFRALRSDSSMLASKGSWLSRVLMFGFWMGLCAAYLAWTPSRRLIMIYHAVTGQGTNLILWSWIALVNDGPRDETNRVQGVFLDSAFSFFVSAYCLTHRALVWGLVEMLLMPALGGGVGLYLIFRGHIPWWYRLVRTVFVFVNTAWDGFDYVEAQITERLPGYLQRRWSGYQQRRPERAAMAMYRYKPLNAGEMRLLVIKKSPFYPSVIRADIVHRPVYPPPQEYEAVSYRWGSSDLSEEIIVDGCRFPVTRSAFEVLLARRSVWRERTIWIDALCIHQRDVEEKNEQVQLMREIYQRASRVVAFLGGDWRLRLAGPLIYQLFGLSFQYETDSMDWANETEEARTPRWRALADLFSNEYFNRAWVIQEIAVGHKVELYIGGTYIPWMIFAQYVVESWCFSTRRRHMLTGSDEKERRIWRNGHTFENIAVLTTLRPDAEEWTGALGNLTQLLRLENLLYLTFNFRASDPRDKVFAIMGIAGGTDGEADLVKTPDYHLPVEQVFRNAARAVFARPSERRTVVHVLALAGTGFTPTRRHMPSWVPDFGEERLCYPLSTVLDKGARFTALADLPQGIEVPTNDANSLLLKGARIDRMSDLAESGVLDWGLRNRELVDTFTIVPRLHAFVYSAMALCGKHSASPGAGEEMIRERLWSVLIAGRIERERADAKFKKAFPPWVKKLDLIVSARDRAHYEQLVRDTVWDDGDDGDDGVSFEMASAYEHSVTEACLGRRVGITEAGRLCIVPPLSRVGDDVMIPFGAQTPFLVRQRGEGSYELVGEAWVEGVMYGEMVGSVDEEIFRIS